ncbi:hypothetical protein HPB47_007421, partial [Ixodes persulcatus]
TDFLWSIRRIKADHRDDLLCRLHSINMKGCALFFAGVVLLGVLAFRADAGCPANKGISSDCSFTTCSEQECAAQGLECCPKPCGGSWCVKGVSDGERRVRSPTASACPEKPLPPPRGGCKGGRASVTCDDFHCGDQPCCVDSCGKPYCLPELIFLNSIAGSEDKDSPMNTVEDITPGQQCATTSSRRVIVPTSDIELSDFDEPDWKDVKTRKKRKKTSPNSSLSAETVCSAAVVREGLAVVFTPLEEGHVITSLSSLKLSLALEKMFPECILEIRFNNRLNLIAVDVRNGQTTRGLLRCTVLCGIKVRAYEPLPRNCATGVIRDVDTTLTDEEIANNLRPKCSGQDLLLWIDVAKLHLPRSCPARSFTIPRESTSMPQVLPLWTSRGNLQAQPVHESGWPELPRKSEGPSSTAQDTLATITENQVPERPAYAALTKVPKSNQTEAPPTKQGPISPDLILLEDPTTSGNTPADPRKRRTPKHGKPVPRKSAVRVLGFTLQSNAKATQSLHQLTTQCNQIMHMLRRVSNRRNGLNEADALRLVQALIHTRLLYHLPYHNLTQTEHKRAETGARSPRSHSHRLLERLGVTNTLEELIEAHEAAQLTRLRLTAQGQSLLATVGFPPCPASLTAAGLSPTARAKLTVAPIPRHMHPTRHSARRDHRSRYLRRAYTEGCDTVRALFTDASPQDARGGITVVVNSDLRPVHAAAERGLTDVSLLEERAVARAILSTSTLSSSTPTHILTDSQTASELRLARQHYPPPQPSLTRRQGVLWRQLQTNTFPTPLFYSYVYPSLGAPECPHCGDRPTLLHMVWQCQAIPPVSPLPNPSPTSREDRLTDDTATGQQWLVDRAESVAAT